MCVPLWIIIYVVHYSAIYYYYYCCYSRSSQMKFCYCYYGYFSTIYFFDFYQDFRDFEIDNNCFILNYLIIYTYSHILYIKISSIDPIYIYIHTYINRYHKNRHNRQMIANKSNSRYIQQNLITAMAFSRSEQFCCLATKKNIKLLVFKVKDIANFDSWEFIQELHDQSQPISEIDWSKDDKIISGSHDRSVFIYQRTNKNMWQKMLVNIDIKLSILCVKWAPSGKKFGLGASCNTVAIGFNNAESACWTVSTRDKLCKAPVISLSFHPSSNIVAIGSSDNSIKIISCNFKNSKETFVQKSDIQDKSYQGPFANVDTIFQVLFAIEDVGGWANHVSFELNGSFLLVLPHSNIVRLFDITDNQGKVGAKQTTIKWTGLPFLSGYISDKGILYAGGYDKKVAVFTRSANGFNFANFLENNEKTSKQRASKGIVSNMLSGIEKKGVNVNISEGVNPANHLNPIKVLSSPGKKFVVSYDVSGGVHFWA